MVNSTSPTKKLCEYCRVIDGLQDADIVYSDESVIAIRPEHQVTKGHLIVAPKEHYATIFTIDSKSLDSVLRVARKLSDKIQLEDNQIHAISIIQASKDIASTGHITHFHLHVIPRHDNDNVDIWLNNTKIAG